MGEHYDHVTLEDRCAIARLHEGGQSLRQIAAALDRSPSTVSRELKRNRGAQVGYKPAYAQQQASARRWKGSRLERDDALRTRVLGCLERGWSPEQVAGWLGRQNAATCPEPSSNAGGAAAEAAPPPASSRTGSPLTNDLPTSDTGVARDIGRPISCSSPPTVRPSSSPRNASPASSCLPSNPAKQLSRPSNNSSPGSSPSTASSAKPSRSTTEPSSLSTTNSPASSASGPSSAIPTAPGKKAASKTPSAACEDPCRARQTSRPSTATPSTPASPPTTTHPASASDTNHPLRPSLLNCCTSNVNPPPRFRGGDSERESVLQLELILH